MRFSSGTDNEGRTGAGVIAPASPVDSHFIQQDYSRYQPRDHSTWKTLYQRMIPFWERYANPRYLDGIARLRLDPERVPRLEDVNRFLHPLTGFEARAVSGYIPAFEFFDCLRNRQFPTTIKVRPTDQLDYYPEPDIFHDVAGHVPMHTDRAFAEALVRFGECAHEAAGRRGNPEAVASNIRAMARFFWFTVEFGLMRTPQGIRAYGSGLLSSHGELEHSIESPAVQRYPLQLEWAINQGFDIDHYQPLLFTIRDFEELYQEVGRLTQWMREGRLDNVAPGEPEINARDLESFLSRG
jgi:phenylalanine-4-hydroxylase